MPQFNYTVSLGHSDVTEEIAKLVDNFGTSPDKAVYVLLLSQLGKFEDIFVQFEEKRLKQQATDLGDSVKGERVRLAAGVAASKAAKPVAEAGLATGDAPSVGFSPNDATADAKPQTKARRG